MRCMAYIDTCDMMQGCACVELAAMNGGWVGGACMHDTPSSYNAPSCITTAGCWLCGCLKWLGGGGWAGHGKDKHR